MSSAAKLLEPVRQQSSSVVPAKAGAAEKCLFLALRRKMGSFRHFFYDAIDSKGFLTPEKRNRNEINAFVKTSVPNWVRS